MTRPYGEEYVGDVYASACSGSVCRLARHNRNGYGCPGDPGTCRLVAKADRASRVRHLYFDNRRTILHTMSVENNCTVIVNTTAARGLPMNMPVTIVLENLNDDPYAGHGPYYVAKAEGKEIDVAYTITVNELKARLDGPPPTKPNSSAGNKSMRR